MVIKICKKTLTQLIELFANDEGDGSIHALKDIIQHVDSWRAVKA